MNTHHHQHGAAAKAPQASAIRLSDAALILLGNAAARPDGMVLPPPTALRARGSALVKVLNALLKADLVVEVPVETDAQSWRTDEGGGRIGLVITAEGFRAIGLPVPKPAKKAKVRVALKPTALKRADDAPSAAAIAPMSDGVGEPVASPPASRKACAPPEAAPPEAALPEARRTTKQARLVTLLSGDGGRSVAMLAETLSWQHHTVRAALTGLRQKGHVLAKTKDAAGTTVYRIAGPDAAAPNGVAPNGAMRAA